LKIKKLFLLNIVTALFLLISFSANALTIKEKIQQDLSKIGLNDKIILKCDCNCTNEENKFYINSINPIEASRLVSLDGISKITFDNLKNNKKLCKRRL